LHQSNDITTAVAAAAVENLFLHIDRKPIAAAAYGARADTFTATD
jgi:hypothetical protein